MTYKTLMNKLDTPKKQKILELYDNRINPTNTGIYLSPKQWDTAWNSILTEVIGEKIELKGLSLNAVVSRLLS